MMSGARSRQAGRVRRAKRIQGQVALIFLALGSIGSLLLGHEIAGDLAVRAIYTTASQDQLRYPPDTLRAGGALGARISMGAPRSGTGSSARRTPPGEGSHTRSQGLAGRGGQAHKGQTSNPACQGPQPGWIVMGTDGSPTSSGLSGGSTAQSGNPNTPPPSATTPVAASLAVASSPANIAPNGSDDAVPAGAQSSRPSPSTDQAGDETTGKPCITAPSESLASPHDASAAGSEG